MSVIFLGMVTLHCLLLKSHRIPALFTGLVCLGSVWGPFRPLKDIAKTELTVNA